MRGPFAGWSEREVAELADRLAESAQRFPLHGLKELAWGETEIDESCGGSGSGTQEGEGDEFCCPICQSCGEEACCSVEKSLMNHGCKYSQYYAQQAYYDKMVIDEFHKLADDLGLTRDETGGEVKDPIGDLYDRAWKRVEDKYGRPHV
jgi:hypothetical protein